MCFDGESPTLYSEDHPIARKEHQCIECRETIPKGARYQRVSGKWDGHIDSHATCARCDAVRERVRQLEQLEGCHGIDASCPFGYLREYLQEAKETFESIMSEETLTRAKQYAAERREEERKRREQWQSHVMRG